jgi:hypothetical protein
LVVKDLDGPAIVAVYLSGLGILLWNRLDSRGKAYNISFQGPGGFGVHFKPVKEVPLGSAKGSHPEPLGGPDANEENAFENKGKANGSELEAPEGASSDSLVPSLRGDNDA